MTQPLSCPHHPQMPVVAACARCGDFGCQFCLPHGRRICARCAPGVDPAMITKPDLGKALPWVFQDPRWVGKVLTGAGCMLFGGFILPMMIFLGYTLRISRREREAPQATLPEFDDVGALMSDGFKLWIASIVPGLVMMLGMVAVGAIAFAVIALTAGSGSKDAQAIVAAVFGIGMFGFVLLMIPLGFLFAYAQPAMRLHYLRTGRLTAMIEVREIYKICAHHPGDYFNLAISCFVSQMIANFCGQLLCLVGIFVTMPWALYTDAWLIGRYWAWLETDEHFARGA